MRPSRVKQSRLQALAANAAYCEVSLDVPLLPSSSGLPLASWSGPCCFCCAQLVRWFSDYPGAPHVYSLHNLVHLGAAKYDKPAGQWVGPSTAAYMLR